MTDGLPEDLMEVTPDIWHHFPPEHPLIVRIFSIVLFLLWVVNACGNGLVVIVFLSTKSLRSPTNMLVVNLAVSDLCMMTTMGLPPVINTAIAGHWIFGTLICKLYGSAGALFGKILAFYRHFGQNQSLRRLFSFSPPIFFGPLQQHYVRVSRLEPRFCFVPGTVSLVTMVFIGWDRYNVIVKGLQGQKLTKFKAFAMIIFIWFYALIGCTPP